MRMAVTRFQHDVSLNDTFFRLFVFGGGVATSHQNVCHLFHKVDHEKATENPDFSEWPTSVYELTLLNIVLQEEIDFGKHVSQGGGQDDPSSEAGKAGDNEASLGTIGQVHLFRNKHRNKSYEKGH